MTSRDFRQEVLDLYVARFGIPPKGKPYPPEVYHGAPALMRQTGCTAEVALDRVLAGERPVPNSFSPREKFPEE